METISRYLLTFLLNSLWQIPLVTAVAMLVCRTLRNGPAAHRYAVWVASLLAAMVLPLASLRTVKPVAPVRLTVSYAPPAIASNPSSDDPAVNASANRAPASDLRIFSFAQTTATVLLGCYLLFLLFNWCDWHAPGTEPGKSAVPPSLAPRRRWWNESGCAASRRLT